MKRGVTIFVEVRMSFTLSLNVSSGHMGGGSKLIIVIQNINEIVYS